MPIAYTIAVVVPPLLVIAARRRLLVRAIPALVVTYAITLAAAATLLWWFVPDPSRIGDFYTYFLFVVPFICIPCAAILATRIVRVRGELVNATLLAAVGWYAGLALAVFGVLDAAGSGDYFWDYVYSFAIPVSYAVSAAVVCAALPPRDGVTR